MVYWRSAEDCENGVRYRLAACKKRLRNARTTHRAKLLQLDETLREIAMSPAGTLVTYVAAVERNEQPGNREAGFRNVFEEPEVGQR